MGDGRSGGDRSARRPLVAIAVCTYRRREPLAQTLAGLARLTFRAASQPDLRVIVADNEGDPRIGDVVAAFAARSGFRADCIIEPRRGIAHARNACLDAVPDTADFLAFIDDDEIPAAHWLDALLATQRASDAAVVCGPVLPDFERTPPRWVTDGGFFRQPRRPAGGRETPADGDEVPDAGTGNVLIRMADVRQIGLRFDEAFGLTGGEDALFFRRLRAAGGKIVWSPQARVTERVPSARAGFRYLAREYFRCGNVRATIDALDARDRGRSGARSALGGAKKALRKLLVHAALLVAAAAFGRGRARVYGHAFELANAVGRLSGLFGFRYEHYR